MTQPFFSIITVCRNEERYIDLTAASVVAQTYKNYEWLVLDGKSTDKTLKILQKYKKNMAYFTSKKDKGIYYAMNEGAAKAKGQYLIFMNGGDMFYQKDALKKAHEFITNDDHKHKIYFGATMFHNNNIHDIYESPRNSEYKIGRGLNKRYFFYNTICHQSTFINKKLFAKYGNYDTDYHFLADWQWFIRTIREKNIYINMIVSIFNMSSCNERATNLEIHDREMMESKKMQLQHYSLFFICFQFLYLLMIDIYLYKYSFLQKPWRALKKMLKK